LQDLNLHSRVLPQTIQPGEVTLCKRHLNIFTGAKGGAGM